ncbi:MAG: hypothetical protein Q8O41_03495, partial [Candidatus Methanoperedens sp.]|nr:hypothetical protein [Candidatus Methanoperedens sp.]
GAAALTAAIVLTYMIFWMAQNSKKIKGEVQEKNRHRGIKRRDARNCCAFLYVVCYVQRDAQP